MQQEHQEVTSPHLSNLNDPQRKAVETVHGPVLILAGAGSGKTRVLTRRVVHLISEHGVAPERILAVTFTNKATQEMQQRIRLLLAGGREEDAHHPGNDAIGRQMRQPWVATFHSAALRILRRHAQLLGYSSDFVVYDSQDSMNLLKELLKRLNIDDKKYPPPLFRRAIDRAKNEFILSGEFAKNARSTSDTIIAEVYDQYQRRLFQSNAMDFGDLLVNVLRLFREHPGVCRMYQHQFEHILVDEFQDTNHVQYQLIKLLCQPQRNLLVVGDDDQSIYAFRGATIENILNFESDFPDATVIKLEQNYRSTATILESAHAVISRNQNRKDKKLWTAGAVGSPLQSHRAYNEADEAAYIAHEISKLCRVGKEYSDFAVFYRTNAQSRALEESLMSRGIPYRIYGGLKFYERKEVKDILAYLKLIVNERDSQAFLRVVNNPPRGIGPQTVKAITDLASELGCSLPEAAAQLADRNKNIQQFVQLLERLQKEAQIQPPDELIRLVVEGSEYRARLEAAKDVTAQSRIENLDELRAIALTMDYQSDVPFEQLRAFLDRVSLSAADELPEKEAQEILKSGKKGEQPNANVVSLMTLHLAKGLEFPVVFLTGFEEGFLPHYRSIDDPTAVSEERRLCYVGMTRAIEKLYITRADSRGLFSASGGFDPSSRFRQVSRFAFDIPPQYVDGQFPRFLAEPDSFDDEDSDYTPEQRSSFGYKGKTTTKVHHFKKPVTLVVKTADALETAVDHTAGLKAAEIEDLALGKQVVHPSFGKGEVVFVEGAEHKDPRKVKVGIRFDQFDTPKKLVFKFARLALSE